MVLLIIFFTFIVVMAAFSMENMFLTGLITKINYNAKQVQIDLLSKGCKGDRTFTFNDISIFKKTEGNKISSYNVGDKIIFYIDSESCPRPFEVRVITAVRGVK